MKSSESLRLPGADGLRAIACLLVVWHHTTQKLNPEGLSPVMAFLHFLGMRGEVGVSIFFVLSGCLLSLPFWTAFAKQGKFPSIKNYAMNRWARIAPAFWLNLIVCYILAIAVFGLEVRWDKFAGAFLFVNSYDFSTFFPSEINGPLWSIGLEVSCYALLPFAIYFVYRLARGLPSALAMLAALIVTLQLLNPFVISATMTDEFGKGWEFGIDGGAKLWIPYWNINSFFSQFLLGSLAALLIVALRERAVKLHWMFDAGAVASLASSIALVSIRLTPGAPDVLTQQPYVSPFLAALIAAALVCSSRSMLVASILDNRLFSWLAKISFGIYLWHVVVIEFIARQFVGNYVYFGMKDQGQWALISSLVLLISVGIAALSWKWFEAPILRRVRNRSFTR